MKLVSDTVKLFKEFEPIEFTRMNIDIDLSRNGHCAKQSHSHPFCELYFLIEGEVDFIVENNIIRLNAQRDGIGAVGITRGGELHRADIKKKDYDHAFFFFSEKCFPKFEKDSPLGCFFERARGENNTFVPSESAWRRMREIFENLTELADKREYEHQFSKYGLMLELFKLADSEWKRIYAAKSLKTDDPIDSATSPIANRAASFIASNFRNIQSVLEVAEYCGVTQSYLSRLFKQVYGVKPNEYLRRHRLEYAKTMLLNGYDVTSTCYHVGFTDYSHFIQVFRNYEGMTPLAFQKSRGVIRNDSIEPDF